jgi:hypothetical protein
MQILLAQLPAASSSPVTETSHSLPGQIGWVLFGLCACYIGLDLFIKFHLHTTWSDFVATIKNVVSGNDSTVISGGRHYSVSSRSASSPESKQAPPPKAVNAAIGSVGVDILPELMQTALRKVVQEELAKLRSEISADLQGSLQALANRIDGMRDTPIRKPLIETPASLPVQRAATETDLLTYWRSLRGSNQVSASHMLSLAAASQLTLSEAPGLSTTDPLARLGFLLTDGQGTVWFIPRPAFTPLDLSGVYSFPQERYLAGAITDVVRFARWQGNGIATPGEAK